jgi:hypothetical protein
MLVCAGRGSSKGERGPGPEGMQAPAPDNTSNKEIQEWCA